MAYRASIIKSIQPFSIAITSGLSSATATISAVTTANCFIQWDGFITDGYTGTRMPHAVLTNTTTVTASVNAAGGDMTVSGTVVEFYPGICNSIQAYSITILNGGNTGTATITSVVTTKTMLAWNGINAANATVNAPANMISQVLTNATTVTASNHNSVAADVILYGYAIEFK